MWFVYFLEDVLGMFSMTVVFPRHLHQQIMSKFTTSSACHCLPILCIAYLVTLELAALREMFQAGFYYIL